MQNDGAVLFPEGLMGHLVSWRSARRAAVVADELYAPRDALLVVICLYREGGAGGRLGRAAAVEGVSVCEKGCASARVG